MDQLTQESRESKAVIHPQSTILQIPPVLLTSPGTAETVLQNVSQMASKDAIKIPGVARALAKQGVTISSREEPPRKKAKLTTSGSTTMLPKGIISPQSQFSNSQLVTIDPQQLTSLQATGTTVTSPLFQPSFQTVLLQPTPLTNSPMKTSTPTSNRSAKNFAPIASKAPIVTSAKAPVTKPILMQTGLSNKIVVHAPSSQSATSPPPTNQTMSMSVGHIGATSSQGTIQAPVLSSGRLLQVASASGGQKYILVPPGTTSQSMHLLGNGSQLSLPGNMTVTSVAPTSHQDTPHGKINIIKTSQGSVTVQISQGNPVIMPSTIQSSAKNPLVCQVSESKTKLPSNVRYFQKTQKLNPQIAVGTTVKPPQHHGKILTVGQRVGALTNRNSPSISKVITAVSTALSVTQPCTSSAPMQITEQPIAHATLAPATLGSGQQSIVLHTGNFTKQILSGTPVIFNIPGSGSPPQTAILMPPSVRQNPSIHSKVIKRQGTAITTTGGVSPVGKTMAVAMPLPRGSIPSMVPLDFGCISSIAAQSSTTSAVKMSVPAKVQFVRSVQACTAITTSSVVTTMGSVNSNITRAVPAVTIPAMTTMVQNGRLLQLQPAQRGPVNAASQPKPVQKGAKRPLSLDSLIPMKPQEMESEVVMSTVDLALKFNAPYPQAYFRKPPSNTPKTPAKEEKKVDDTIKDPKPLQVKMLQVFGNEDENVEFTWEEYLEITGTVAAPAYSFRHVDLSLLNVVKVGMKVEAPNQPSTLNPYLTYWVASVITACGTLLLLRYEGYGNDRSGDFWCDLNSKDLHPVGWCARNGQMLQPPDTLLHKKLHWQQFLIASLTGAKTIPDNVLIGAIGPLPVDRLVKGRYLDVIDEEVPTQAWIASIIENHGGRLKLRYGGAKEPDDFHIFYLSYRLHPPGWAKEHRVIIKPPKFIQQQTPMASDSHWRSMYFGIVAAANLSSTLPHDFFKIRKVFSKIKVNNMKEGMKIESVNPKAPHQVCPATITKNFNSHFFQVQIDNLDRVDKERIAFVCHADSGGIFPVNWCKEHGFSITPPKGYEKPKFKWSEYLKDQESKAASADLFRITTDRKFQNGMKVEAVNPFNQSQICVATITKIAGRHIWLHFDGSKQPNHIVDSESQNIFPVGWCESVGYPLKSPKRLMAQKKKVAIVWPEKRSLTGPNQCRDLYQRVQEANQDEDSEEGWMPQVYINHKCFSGPYLNKKRLTELPQTTGPGMVTLVLREVLASLINSAYKPNKVLRELQVQNEVTAGQNGYLQIMKAKYKGKSFRALVELPKTVPKVIEFLRETLVKLECCANLVSLTLSGDNCPEKCSSNNKAKCNTNHGGKRKKRGLGRPKKSLHIRDSDKHKAEDTKPPMDVTVDHVKPSEHSATPPTTIMAAKTPLMTRARHIVQTAKLAKLQQTTPRLILPDRKRRGINMMKLTANLRSSRPQKTIDSSKKKKPTVSKKASKKSNGKNKAKEESSPPKPTEGLRLDSNPLQWSVTQVEEFIQDTDCAPLAKVFREQEIDGQALLLLTLPTVQECMDLKLGPAIKLCHHIERIKIAFYEQFAK